ncbi:hypothetical protein [Bartonella refiksaydamii]|uniref:hypothetical protein n=1 Tax=Bartonella refiksaydamii TaxID=2654951 RepID=UPI0012EC8BCE|nr:hypothetical protein [Bartonella refiksaydamii]
MRNRILALNITIGEVLLPLVNNLMESVGNFTNELMAWNNAHPTLINTIIKTIAALMTFNITLRMLCIILFASFCLGRLQLIGSFIKLGGLRQFGEG